MDPSLFPSPAPWQKGQWGSSHEQVWGSETQSPLPAQLHQSRPLPSPPGPGCQSWHPRVPHEGESLEVSQWGVADGVIGGLTAGSKAC